MSATYPEWVVTEYEKRLYSDFRVFLFHIWKHLKLPPPTKLQYRMAGYIANGPRRRLLEAFRGAAKTWITCAYGLWRLYRNPNERIKIVSANENKALENGVFMRRLIEEVPELRFLRPRGDRDSTLKFDVGPADAHPTPSVSCTGIGGQLTGGRATILISDDVEVPGNSMTEVQRERLAELIKEYDALVVPEGFDVIFLGTPQTESSIYNAVRTRGYDCLIFPVRYPELSKIESYGGALDPVIEKAVRDNPSLAGTSTEPGRFTDLDLAEREASYGASGFALQFMLDTSLSDALRYPLKSRDLVCMDLDIDIGPVKVVWTSDARNAYTDIDNLGFTGDRLYKPMHVSETMLPYQGRVMVIDPSGRGKDRTGYVVGFQLHGQVFLRAFGALAGGYETSDLEALAQIAKANKVNTVVVESNFGDGMFAKLLTPIVARIHPCSIEEVRATGQKERRIIEDLEPLLNQHRLVVDTQAVRKDAGEGIHSLMYQLTHITRDRNSLKHDDVLDALAHMARFFWNLLDRDVAKAEEDHLEALRDAARRDFINSYYGRSHLKEQTRFGSTNAGLR